MAFYLKVPQLPNPWGSEKPLKTCLKVSGKEGSFPMVSLAPGTTVSTHLEISSFSAQRMAGEGFLMWGTLSIL